MTERTVSVPSIQALAISENTEKKESGKNGESGLRAATASLVACVKKRTPLPTCQRKVVYPRICWLTRADRGISREPWRPRRASKCDDLLRLRHPCRCEPLACGA